MLLLSLPQLLNRPQLLRLNKGQLPLRNKPSRLLPVVQRAKILLPWQLASLLQEQQLQEPLLLPPVPLCLHRSQLEDPKGKTFLPWLVGCLSSSRLSSSNHHNHLDSIHHNSNSHHHNSNSHHHNIISSSNDQPRPQQVPRQE